MSQKNATATPNQSMSIIVPSRNIDKLLILCTQEIRELYSNIEIIVVVDKYTQDDAVRLLFGVTLTRSLGQNISAKCNLGVSITQKPYVAFIGSDAYPKEGWRESALTFLTQNPSYGAMFGLQLSPPDDSFIQKCIRKTCSMSTHF